MKTILILSLLTGLFSCSGHYHIKKAEKHVEKAELKGVTPTRDTTYINTSDTTIQIDTLDNYIQITKTIRDTVYIEGKTVYIAKSRAEVRQEQKTERTKLRQENKTKRKEVKQKAKTERKENRKFIWIWFVLAVIGWGIVIYKKFKNRN